MSGVVRVEERRVVVLGKSGGGKSTVANMLLGYDPLAESPPFEVSNKVLASVTRDVTEEMGEFRRGRILYRLKLIDTVGLFDTDAEDNDEIFEKIEEYLKDHADGINIFLFVFKKGRFTQEEKEVFSFVRSKFDQEISPISALAVTNCEQDSPEDREAFVEEFKSDSSSQEIAQQMQLGIYPVGFPPLNKMRPRLRALYEESMEEDKETLLELIIRAKKVHLTKKLLQEKVVPAIKVVYVERKARRSGPCTLL